MTRVEIEIGGNIENKQYIGDLKISVVNEIGENSINMDSDAGKIQLVIAKSIEQHLKKFLPQFIETIQNIGNDNKEKDTTNK